MESLPQNPEFRNNPENFHGVHVHWMCLIKAPRVSHREQR